MADFEMKRIAIWDITSKCNLRCEHCYNQERYWDKADQFEEMTCEQIDTMLSKLVELNFTRVHLLGGEPMLSSNFLYIVKKAHEMGLETSTVTNGTFLKPEIVKQLCELHMKGLSVSLDGITAETNDRIRGQGTFNLAIKNLQSAINMKKEIDGKIDFGISFTLTKYNLKDTDIVNFCENLGVNALFISYLSNEGEARHNFSYKSITEQEKFDFLDAVFETYDPQSDLILAVDARGYLSEYIYKKFGIRLTEDSVGCRGGNEQFYILCDGTLLPCSPADTSIGRNVLAPNISHRAYPNLLHDTALEIQNSPSHICFYNFAHDLKTFEHLQPCGSCSHNCRPCPLLYFNKECVPECMYAIERIRQLDEMVLKTVFSKSPILRVENFADSTVVLNFLNENLYTIDGTAHEIWCKIDGNTSIKSIVDHLFGLYSEQISYDALKKDILDCVYDFLSLKLLVKHS